MTAAQGRLEVIVKPRKKAKQNVETKTKAAAPAAASATKTEATPAPATARPQKIKVLKKDATFRSETARAAWFARIKEYDGKPESEFLESVKENPPSRTKNGAAEPPSGWVRFFVRQGVMSLQP